MKNKFTFLSILITFYISGLQAQVTQEWVQRYGISGNSTESARKVITDNSGNVYVCGYSAETGIGSEDILLLKYSSSGALLWQRKYIGSEGMPDYCSDMGIDNSGNIYVTGVTISNINQCVTIKYNPDGDSLWVRKYPGAGSSNFVTPSGNVFVASPLAMYNTNGDLQWIIETTFANDITADILENVYTVTELQHSGDQGNDCLTKKFNSAGVQQWETIYSVPFNRSASPSSIAVSSAGNVCLTGFYGTYGASDLGDIFTLKYNSSGIQQWINLYPGTAVAAASGHVIKIDNFEKIYVTGGTGFLHGMITLQYSSDGNLLWNYTSSVGTRGWDLILDASNNVYVTGTDISSIWQCVTEKYNNLGQLQWSMQYGQTGSCDAYSLALDASGNVYVSGVNYEPGRQLFLTIKYSQLTGISQISNSSPVKFSLSQNYPNPFNPKTIINYELGNTNNVSLKVFDILGNEVAALVNEKQNAGTYSVDWDAGNFPSGVYFYKLQAGEFVETKRMTLVK